MMNLRIISNLSSYKSNSSVRFDKEPNKLNIRNKTQVKTWWKWYRNGESYRFSQGVGKQYTYGKGNEHFSPLEVLERENKYLKQEIDVLKKYKELERMWKKKYS